MGMECRISTCVIVAIQRAAAATAPLEACGLLFGSADEITAMSQAINVAGQPETRFEIDPAALFAALRAERAGGPQIAGYWHSHPGGDPTPSATDAAMAEPDGKVWLIAGGGVVTAWRAAPHGRVEGRFDSLEVTAISGLLSGNGNVSPP